MKKKKVGLIFGIVGAVNTSITIIIILGLLVGLAYLERRYAVHELCLTFSNDERVLDHYEKADITGEPSIINVEDYSKDSFNVEEGIYKNFFLKIFPETLDGGTASLYSYYIEDTITYSNFVETGHKVELFLEWTAPLKESFDNELLNIQERCHFLYSTDALFNAACFVYYYNYFGSFIYCVFDESENTIAYVTLYDVGKIENIVFDEKYIPTKCFSEAFDGDCVIENGNKMIHAYTPVL